jgi:hypothetical protein
MVFLLPIFHRLNTNPTYIILMAGFTGVAANFIKAFTTEASIFMTIPLPIIHWLNTNPIYDIFKAGFTGGAASFIKAFTTQASIAQKSHGLTPLCQKRYEVPQF